MRHQTKVSQSMEGTTLRHILLRYGDEAEASKVIIEQEATDAFSSSCSAEQRRPAAFAFGSIVSNILGSRYAGFSLFFPEKSK